MSSTPPAPSTSGSGTNGTSSSSQVTSVVVSASSHDSSSSLSPSPTMTGVGMSGSGLAPPIGAGASLRLDRWHEEQKVGEMTMDRRVQCIGELLVMQGDLLAASAADLTRCLSLLHLGRIKVGKAGSAERAAVPAILRSKVVQIQQLIEERGKEEQDALLAVVDSDHDTDHEEQQQALASPISSTRPPRRQASLSRGSSLDHPEDGVTEAEMTLIEMLLAGRVPVSVEASLSTTGAALLRLLQRQQPAAPSATASPSAAVAPAPSTSLPRTFVRGTVSSARVDGGEGGYGTSTSTVASLSSRRANVIGSLPIIDLSSSGPRPSASSPHASSHSARRSVAFGSDAGDGGEQDSDVEPEDPPPTGTTLPKSISVALVRMGVLEDLALDDALAQTAATVYPSSYQLFWSSREATITDKKLYYEGLVLSMLLDAADNSRLLLEIASRRWLSLSLVAAGWDWGSAQAWLPLARTNGVTARQLQLMGRFAKATTHPARPAATSAATSYSKGSSYQRSSSRRSSTRSSSRDRSGSRGRASGGSSSSNSSGSSSNSNSNSSNNTRQQRGAGTRANRASDVPGAAAS